MFTKSTFLVLIISIFATTSAISTIYRVNNNTETNPDFTTLLASHDGVSAGDTLYVAGSAQSYGGLILTKKLFIFGPGYFLEENSETQARPLSAMTDTPTAGVVTFNAGSEGSLITGLLMNSWLGINVNNITLKRNKIKAGTGTYGNLVGIKENVVNVIIVQNYIVNTVGRTISVGSNCKNIIIKNNYLESPDGNCSILAETTASVDAQNNVLYGTVAIYYSNFYNNILRSGNFAGSHNDVRHNIGNSTQFGSDNGNQSNIDMNTVFVGTGSTDGKWQLADGSPAIGAGLNGEDCGMFGGDDPCVLSGLPTIPAIYFYEAPVSGSGSQGLPVHVKIKSHN